MDDETIADVSSLDFEPWVKFIFDHPVIKYPGDSWYWSSGERFVATNPQRLLEHFTRLCLDFPEIASRYTLQQIDQGIWFLLSEPNRLGEHLADASIPFAIRLTCIRSMLNVFSEFVTKSKIEVMENCFDMWWDFICHDFWIKWSFRGVSYEAMAKRETFEEFRSSIPEFNYEHLSAEDKSLLDAMFETLAEILNLNEERCNAYALHGLGHLKHPLVKQLVQSFIDRNKSSISTEGLKWLEACRDGKVM
jgi:hypothetical protein